MIFGPVILFSITIHEFFHAWTAYRFGDDTAARAGRMTLNPLAHLDLVGSLVMVLSQFTFGWAKPVPVNPMNLRNPRVADIWISAAGPLSNLGLAVLAGLGYRLFEQNQAISQFMFAGVMINVVLAFFNLIPLFPLDGSHILRNLLPRQQAEMFDQFSRFAPFVLLLLIITRIHWVILGPPVMAVIGFLLGG